MFQNNCYLASPFFFVYGKRKNQSEHLKYRQLFAPCNCKIIRDSVWFRIPWCGPLIIGTGFMIPPQLILDSKRSFYRDSGFLDLDSWFQIVGFLNPQQTFSGFWIPWANVFWIPVFGLFYMGTKLLLAFTILILRKHSIF